MAAGDPAQLNRLAKTYRGFLEPDGGAAGFARDPRFLTTQFFPRSVETPDHLRALRPTFEALNQFVFSEGCDGRGVPSNLALEQVVVDLQALGYEVEHQPTSGSEKKQKIGVPMLFGPDDVALRRHDADAVNWVERTVVEVEAGTAVANNAYLKDVFEASLAVDIDYLALAVRKLYVTDKTRGNADFATVYDKLETLFLSERFTLPLKGILLLGY